MFWDGFIYGIGCGVLCVVAFSTIATVVLAVTLGRAASDADDFIEGVRRNPR